MKTKGLAFLLTLCMVLGVCTSVAQAGPIILPGDPLVPPVSVLYLNQVSEDEEPYITTERTEYTQMMAICGEEDSEYTLTEDVSGMALLINNTAVTIGEGGAYAMTGLLGAASLTDGNLVLTPPEGTPAFNGDPSNYTDWSAFFDNGVGDAFAPNATYNGDLTSDEQFPYMNLTVHGDLTVAGDWMYHENLTVDGNLTVCTIFNVDHIAVAGNIFIQAPEGGDPNGLNIRWDGSLTLGGTFTADDGQIFELNNNAAVYGDVPLYVFDGEELVPFALEAEHELLDFTYAAGEAVFIKQENGGWEEDDLLEFDARLDYDHARALITVLIDGAEPFTVYGGERFFFTYDDQPHPLSFSIDTAHSAWGDLAPEGQIKDLSVSVFYYQKDQDNHWIGTCVVRAGEATDERFTFESNTLSFTPASTAPFYMEICLTEEEYAFATMSPEEGEVYLEYAVDGFGGVTEGIAKRRAQAAGRTRMIFDLTDEKTVFTNITPHEGESLVGFRFQYDWFFLDSEKDMTRLAERGVTYDAEAGTLTVAFSAEEQYLDLLFWFSGGNPGDDLNDFDARVNYDDNRVVILAHIGQSDPFDLRGGDRFFFGDNGEIQPVSLTIDTTRNIWGEAREEEQDMSVFVYCRWRDHEDRDVWHEAYIVRAGVVEEAYRERFTFENNTLTFTPENEEPFELDFYLNEAELAYNQMAPGDGEVLIQYEWDGRGGFSVGGYKDEAHMGGMTKLIFDVANEKIVFTNIEPDEGEELIGFRFMDEDYDVESEDDMNRLAGRGVTYDAEAHTLTITMNAEQPYLFLTIRFSDYGSSWLGVNEFTAQYRFGFGSVRYTRSNGETGSLQSGFPIEYAAGETICLALNYRVDSNGFAISEGSEYYIADKDISPWILLRDERTHEETWIVEAGAVPENLKEQFTFEDNTLVFKAENDHPFVLDICWTDAEYAYYQTRPQYDEQEVYYYFSGDNSVQVIGALREGRLLHEGKAILPREAQEVSFLVTSAESNEFYAIFVGEWFIQLQAEDAAERLAEAGIRIEGNVVTIPISQNQNRVEFFFTAPWGGEDLFSVTYDTHDFYAVVDINGQGGALVNSDAALNYPDGEFVINVRIGKQTDRDLRGIALYRLNAPVTYIAAEEMEWDGETYGYTWSDREVFQVSAIGYGEPFENEYKVEYNEACGTVTYNGEAIRSGRVLSCGESAISLKIKSSDGQAPYRIFAECFGKGDDVTDCWQDGVFTYEPTDSEAMRLRIYWTEEEFAYDNFRENWDETLVEFIAQGKGHIEVFDENGDPLTNVETVTFNGSVKLILPRDAEKTMRVNFVPDEDETVERVETAEGFLSEEAYAGNTILWTPDTTTNRAWMQVFFSDSTMGPCPHDEGTHLQGHVDATCTTDGYTGDVVCNRCGEVFEQGTVIPATGHTPEDEWQFNEHEHWKNCATDHAPLAETYGEHSESRWIVDSAPNGETPGHRHTECTVCGCTLRDEDYTEAKGDLTGDGEVTDRDRMILSRYLAGWDITEYGVDASDIEQAMDLNGDGKVTAIDRAILARYLAGWGNEYTMYF